MSLRNADKSFQRLHRERHQPEKRAHLGLLEKKQDYRKRADDYNKKQKRLRKLRQLALDKNPDEFFFHMINSKVKDGKHMEKQTDDVFTPEQLKLMQSQDIKYINYARNIELKKIEKLKSSLHLIDVDGVAKNSHTFFVDTKKEAKTANPAKRLNTHKSLLDKVGNVTALDTLENEQIIDAKTLKLLPKIETEREKAYKELSKRIEREKQLKILLDKMSVKSALMIKNATLVQEGTSTSAPVYKWKKQRQK